MPSSTDLADILADPWKRYCSLYQIVNKDGKRVKFTPNPEQTHLFREMHNRNIIPKARQLGMTTAIQLWMLDRALFTPNMSAGVIAHNREDAQRFFDGKIKFAYEHLPGEIQDRVQARNDNANELTFSNGSSIRVGTSLRSGTYQMLHVSEFGKICAKYPDKAREIVTGSLNTVPTSGVSFIESTAEGAYGEFHAMCKQAEQLQAAGYPLSALDYKLFFYPWWKSQDYRLDDPVNVDQEMAVYFQMLREEHGINLDRHQQSWYVRKAAEQGSMMRQEYPSYLAEAFHVEIEGQIYAKQIGKARAEGRITNIPIAAGHPVFTFWDLGRNDAMAIWFMQRVGMENRFIDYHEDSGYNLEHYVQVLKEKGYVYGDTYLPHDARITDLSRSDGLTRAEVMENHGLKVLVVPRVSDINIGIELTRQAFNSCYFDANRCERGIQALEAYQYEYDERKQTNRKTPLHNWASNGADAFRQFAQGFRGSDHKHQFKNDQLARVRTKARDSRRRGTSYRV